MSNKLLWSWSIEDTREALNKYNIKLPDWMECVAIVIGFGGFLYIFNITIVPMSGNWILYVTSFFMFVALYLKIAGIKPKTLHGDGWYLEIYNDKLRINIENICVNYDFNNIKLDTLTVKYITYWSVAGGPAPIKGLCFNTITTNIKVPLITLLPRHIKELKQVINMLKQQSVVTAC